MTEKNFQLPPHDFSLRKLFLRYRWRITITWTLVLGEAATMLSFPLFMGIAIDDLLNQRYFGLYQLCGIGLATVILGGVRRFYDTRVYSRIYAQVSNDIVAQESSRNSEVTVTAARTKMAGEFVDFFEDSFPEIINSMIGLFGTLAIIFFLQTKSFFACLVGTAIILILYVATSRLTFRFNKGANDQSERHVDVLSRNDPPEIADHFNKIIRWNIRLSDLETVTFSLSWMVMIGVLAYSIFSTVQDGVTSYGKVLSILMYVFGYIESVIVMPLFYQQLVRLKEISQRFRT